jgi:hypothetical protein
VELLLQFILGAVEHLAPRGRQVLAGTVDVEGQRRERGAVRVRLARLLRSAERFSEAAIFFGSRSVNTPPFRSSASLVSVTRFDQPRPPRFAAVLSRTLDVFALAFFATALAMTGPLWHAPLAIKTPAAEARSALASNAERLKFPA